MAVLRVKPSHPNRAVLKGRIIVDTWRGQIRVRSWPGARTTPTTQAERQWRTWFRWANILAKYAAPQMQITVNEAVKGTPFMPRDLHVAAMAGRLVAMVDQNGGKWYPMAFKRDVSDSLDALSQTYGAVLYRNTEFWQGIPPGQDGQVLTSQGPALPPVWADQQGGGGGALVFLGQADADAGALVLDNLIVGQRDTIIFELVGVRPSNTNTPIRVNFRSNGGNAATNYRWVLRGILGTGADATQGFENSGSARVSINSSTHFPSNGSPDSYAGTFKATSVRAVNAAPRCQWQAGFTGENGIEDLSLGAFSALTAVPIDGFRVIAPGGSIAAGSIRAYALTPDQP